MPNPRVILGMSILILVASGMSTAAESKAACTLVDEQREALLKLPFAQFDQEDGSGWRPLYEMRCYTQAADLLAAYMVRNSDLVERHPELANQVYILPAHAGQMYALAGQYDKAIGYLEMAYQETSQTLINWNAYMTATIAFLRRDRAILQQQRDLIARQPPMPRSPGVPERLAGKKVNLDIVDRLLACFDEPFEAGFRDGCDETADMAKKEASRSQPVAEAGR